MSYAESFKHPDIQQLRRDLLLGERNPICRVCWSDENLGMVSTRQLSIRHKPIEVLEKEVTNPKLKWLWADPGNYCNFACRTCFSDFSTTLGVENRHKWNNPNLLEIRKPDLTVLKDQDLSDIDTVSILGGEPFLNLEHLDIVDSIIQQKTTKKFTMIYVTNNSKRLPDRVTAYLKSYPGIKIIVVLSIDAVGKPFEYIRTNGKWADFLTNFQYLSTLRDQGHNISTNANITISALNLLYLDPLYDWLHANGIDNNTTSSAFVEGCHQYSFQIFTDKKKQKIVSQLADSQHDFSHIAQALEICNFDQSLLDQFWSDCDWTKNYHGMAIEHYLPELIELLTFD